MSDVPRYSFTLRSDFGEYQVGELRVTPDGELVAYDALAREVEAANEEFKHLSKKGYATATICIHHGCQHAKADDVLRQLDEAQQRIAVLEKSLSNYESV